MKHKASASFRDGYERLSFDIRKLADKNFGLLKADPALPSLQFKKVGELWSVSVGMNYRALATPIEGGFLWVWVGMHAEYDKLLA